MSDDDKGFDGIDKMADNRQREIDYVNELRDNPSVPERISQYWEGEMEVRREALRRRFIQDNQLEAYYEMFGQNPDD